MLGPFLFLFVKSKLRPGGEHFRPGRQEKGKEEEEKEDEGDGLTSLFESLMADFDKHDDAATTPLYLR